MTRARYLAIASVVSVVVIGSLGVTAFLAMADPGQESGIRGGVYDETPTGAIRSQAPPQQNSEAVQDLPMIVAQANQQQPRAPAPRQPAPQQQSPTQNAPQAAPQAQAAQPAQDPNGPQLVEMFGEWKLQCFGRPLQRCELQQRRIDSRTQATIFWVEIARTPNATDDTITIITPLGMKVSAGITFSLDGQMSQSLQSQTCVQFGCLSQLKANRVLQQKLLQSKELRATVTNLAGQKVTLEMPSNGISEGYNRMFALTNTR